MNTFNKRFFSSSRTRVMSRGGWTHKLHNAVAILKITNLVRVKRKERARERKILNALSSKG